MEPPAIRPRRKGAWRSESLVTYSGFSPSVSATMIEKIIVVAPTTAVPMSTGLAVALNVFPAPSFSSRLCFARSKSGVKPNCDLICSLTPGVDSTSESS